MLVTFWHGRWAGEDLLRNRFPMLFSASSHKHLTISRWVQRFGLHDNLGFMDQSPEVTSELHRLRSLLSGLSLSGLPDAVQWRWTIGGRFSANSAYRFLAFDRGFDCRVRHLWGIKAPLKIKNFLWLGARNRILTAEARNRILTAEVLSRRGWIGPSMCPLCGRDSECVEHLFFQCQFAREVWEWALQGEARLLSDLLVDLGDLALRWSRARLSLRAPRSSLLDLSFGAICWELWMERNRQIFEDKRPIGSEECRRLVVSNINSWLTTLGKSGPTL